MIAQAENINGKVPETLERIATLEEQYFEARKSREPQSSYFAGESDRMNPVPKGIDPLGTGADYHYRTERNYFLMVERGRAAVRNHPLVEQGINRLIANLKLGEFTLDVDSGDPYVDQDQKEFWGGWTGETVGGRNQCDYEGTRSFSQLSCQSFFNQCADGDIIHLPLQDGSLQTWESHHIRNPWGHRPTGLSTDGIIHGVEVRSGRITGYYITPLDLLPGQALTRRGKSVPVPAFDEDGNKIAFWMGFRHRFRQRRGISRLSPPRESMNGFDDLNYANIKSALRRSLISWVMEETQQKSAAQAFSPGGKQSDSIPQAGDRYAKQAGLGLQSITIEQSGEPAQVYKPPAGFTMKGWNADMPTAGFFEQSALLLTMLAVNLDLPLMFLLLDGSLVNFHGGRMTFDQAKLRFRQLQHDHVQGLWNPTYEWKTRQRLTPGSKQFDPKLYAAVKRGANPFRYKFRAAAWPYVKPLEDAAAEDLAERRNLKSMRSILSDRGIDMDEHVPEVIKGRGLWIRTAIQEAQAIQKEFPDIVKPDDMPRLWREIWYGNENTGVQLAISADASGESQPQSPPTKGQRNG
ncbi:phage portal protein [Anatilimnocola sp. NA78]|uniref:phage portal protein n=1 Tax=Anatilimnocola sp. NA78 TaxID=3415683 RepID=UPI003CE4796E